MKMEINWQYIKDSPTRCMALCENDGNRIFRILAKVWRLDSGEWAFAMNSDICTIPDFCGTERNRKLAIIAIEKRIDNQKIQESDRS